VGSALLKAHYDMPDFKEWIVGRGCNDALRDLPGTVASGQTAIEQRERKAVLRKKFLTQILAMPEAQPSSTVLRKSQSQLQANRKSVVSDLDAVEAYAAKAQLCHGVAKWLVDHEHHTWGGNFQKANTASSAFEELNSQASKLIALQRALLREADLVDHITQILDDAAAGTTASRGTTVAPGAHSPPEKGAANPAPVALRSEKPPSGVPKMASQGVTFDTGNSNAKPKEQFSLVDDEPLLPQRPQAPKTNGGQAPSKPGLCGGCFAGILRKK